MSYLTSREHDAKRPSRARAQHNKRKGRSSSQLCRPTTRQRIYLRDGHRCVWCGRGAEALGVVLTLDHVIPREQGGSNRFWNLVTACLGCNSRHRHEPAMAFAERAFGPLAPAVAVRVLRAVGAPLPALLREPWPGEQPQP